MQGAGNDYVYVDCTTNEISNPNELSVKISDRHFGVGSDGLVLICKSAVADFKMRMFNADGSEAQMCGNAARCIGKYVYEKGLTTQTAITLETPAGTKRLQLFIENNVVEKVQVDMGAPELTPAKIPVKVDVAQAVNFPLEIDGRKFNFTAVSMGNPHAVIFVDDVQNFDVHGIGKSIETHPLFPQKVNVEFVQPLSRTELKMRVWERGSGETWACGTGACATLVAASLNNITDKKATIHLLGGDLEIDWREDGHVYMTGGATTVFEGNYNL
ncbi:diaminopimelate epimerase [Bacteroidia bacterium]|nr:diaminopimelate epimerase [Bacteroidia bacterium]GHT81172.1 diaminopimelate epimerase [Bacteroidia bacterium]